MTHLLNENEAKLYQLLIYGNYFTQEQRLLLSTVGFPFLMKIFVKLHLFGVGRKNSRDAMTVHRDVVERCNRALSSLNEKGDLTGYETILQKDLKQTREESVSAMHHIAGKVRNIFRTSSVTFAVDKMYFKDFQQFEAVRAELYKRYEEKSLCSNFNDLLLDEELLLDITKLEELIAKHINFENIPHAAYGNNYGIINSYKRGTPEYRRSFTRSFSYCYLAPIWTYVHKNMQKLQAEVRQFIQDTPVLSRERKEEFDLLIKAYNSFAHPAVQNLALSSLDKLFTRAQKSGLKALGSMDVDSDMLLLTLDCLFIHPQGQGYFFKIMHGLELVTNYMEEMRVYVMYLLCRFCRYGLFTAADSNGRAQLHSVRSDGVIQSLNDIFRLSSDKFKDWLRPCTYTNVFALLNEPDHDDYINVLHLFKNPIAIVLWKFAGIEWCERRYSACISFLVQLCETLFRCMGSGSPQVVHTDKKESLTLHLSSIQKTLNQAAEFMNKVGDREAVACLRRLFEVYNIRDCCTHGNLFGNSEDHMQMANALMLVVGVFIENVHCTMKYSGLVSRPGKNVFQLGIENINMNMWNKFMKRLVTVTTYMLPANIQQTPSISLKALSIEDLMVMDRVITIFETVIGRVTSRREEYQNKVNIGGNGIQKFQKKLNKVEDEIKSFVVPCVERVGGVDFDVLKRGLYVLEKIVPKFKSREFVFPTDLFRDLLQILQQPTQDNRDDQQGGMTDTNLQIVVVVIVAIFILIITMLLVLILLFCFLV